MVRNFVKHSLGFSKKINRWRITKHTSFDRINLLFFHKCPWCARVLGKITKTAIFIFIGMIFIGRNKRQKIFWWNWRDHLKLSVKMKHLHLNFMGLFHFYAKFYFVFFSLLTPHLPFDFVQILLGNYFCCVLQAFLKVAFLFFVCYISFGSRRLDFWSVLLLQFYRFSPFFCVKRMVQSTASA